MWSRAVGASGGSCAAEAAPITPKVNKRASMIFSPSTETREAVRAESVMGMRREEGERKVLNKRASMIFSPRKEEGARCRGLPKV